MTPRAWFSAAAIACAITVSTPALADAPDAASLRALLARIQHQLDAGSASPAARMQAHRSLVTALRALDASPGAARYRASPPGPARPHRRPHARARSSECIQFAHKALRRRYNDPAAMTHATRACSKPVDMHVLVLVHAAYRRRYNDPDATTRAIHDVTKHDVAGKGRLFQFARTALMRRYNVIEATQRALTAISAVPRRSMSCVELNHQALRRRYNDPEAALRALRACK